MYILYSKHGISKVPSLPLPLLCLVSIVIFWAKDQSEKVKPQTSVAVRDVFF
jgi:hypothetical protein